ncbi:MULTISPECIES: KTSC domain-containing protein [Sphingobium]|uniref:Lysyl-tRNA synthetase n=1 Tax=Sphingobium chungbukense TaxID=56193 RepID=A0A0M3AME8_9SPHN|nr:MULTISPECIES: KTSC domain-containing protein [Sphingobium]KKW91118.1 lysyl-tRNA synthetase [Sphingobium chungbukense]PJG47421.1 KTSC domain-containing protein [Sphingobium sp. LB126]
MPSTAIRQFDYDPIHRRLDVQFVSGKRYSYFDVPAAIVQGMKQAASKGGYFNRLIRDRYRFIRQ